MPVDKDPLGPLPAEVLLAVLARADLHALVAAERVSTSWRRLIREEQALWRAQYLALDDIDMPTKWRLLALDGRGPSMPMHNSRNPATGPAAHPAPMPPGDGRGVSGPPADTASLYIWALHSPWGADFEREVVSKLAPDDPLRARIFDKDGNVRQPEVPELTDIVYQWGTRLDKPDWRRHCLRYMKIRENWAPVAPAVSSITVPLRVSQEYHGLVYIGEDPGDDALLFEVTKELGPDLPDGVAHVLVICVERTTGDIRWFADPAPIYMSFDSVNKQLGLFSEMYDEASELTHLYMSGRAMNHFSGSMGGTLKPYHEADAAFHPNGHIQPFAALHTWGGFFPGDFDNRGDHIELAMVSSSSEGSACPHWEKVTKDTFTKELWDVSAPAEPHFENSHSPKFTDKYVFLNWINFFGPAALVYVYSRATGECVHFLLRSSNGNLASFVYEFNEDEVEQGRRALKDETRPITLRPLDPQSPTYSSFLADLETEDNVVDTESGRQYRVFGMMLTPHGAGLFQIHNGYLVIPHMQEVFDGACEVPHEDRDAYIAQRSILIITRLTAMNIDRDVLQLKTNMIGQHGTTYFLNLQTLPLIAPDIPPPLISGWALRRASPDGWCAGPIQIISDGGATLEILRRRLPGDTAPRHRWGREWYKNVDMMLRITTFVPPV